MQQSAIILYSQTLTTLFSSEIKSISSVSFKTKMQVRQSDYEFAKNLLLLLKQRAKEQPHINHHFESLILSSHLKQDYLELSDRIGLTRKDSTNNLVELVRSAKQTAKYGLRVHYLQDVNKSIEEKLRSYFIDLNKYLKEMCDSSANIWNCFKKIKSTSTGMSVRSQKQQANLGLGFYLTRLKQFKQDVQNSKYSVVRTNQLIKNQNINNRIEQIKAKLLSIYHSLNYDTPFIMKKKEIRDPEIDTVLDQIQKKVNDKTQVKAKEFYINCFVKVLQSRKIQDLKLIQKDIESATKKNEELLLKRALKLYIQDELERQKQTFCSGKLLQTSSSLSSLTPLGQNQNVLNQTMFHTQKSRQGYQSTLFQNQQLKKQISYLTQLIKKHSQNQIIYQNQLNKLKLQLQHEQTKFTYFDRFDLSNQDEEEQLITYQSQEQTNIPSQVTDFQLQQHNSTIQVQIIEDFAFSASSRKNNEIVECTKDYDELQSELNMQIKQLAGENNHLKTQITQYLEEVTLYQSELQREKREKERYMTRIQQLEYTLQQFQAKYQQVCAQNENQDKLMKIELQSFQQKIQELNHENDSLNHKIIGLEYINSRHTEKVEQLEQVIDKLNMEIAELNDEINLKNSTVEVLQLERKQYQSSLQTYHEQIQLLNHRNRELRDNLLKSELSKQLKPLQLKVRGEIMMANAQDQQEMEMENIC